MQPAIITHPGAVIPHKSTTGIKVNKHKLACRVWNDSIRAHQSIFLFHCLKDDLLSSWCFQMAGSSRYCSFRSGEIMVQLRCV